MKPYRNRSGKSGVAAYESGEGYIRVRFIHDGTYEYDATRPGRLHVGNMQKLADAGIGLSTYISRFVRERYARKLD
ncbi:hypothetical protein FHW84_001987 [Dyella sp. SG562]|uniref:hypothetical protein n=1 Tax=Dyella TaxID=231454 RepID=UPI001423B0BF|nr:MULTISPECIES: hypothetical protein [unclassified Dyella]NII73415.1 hypothetical protein [Dyella sp. SG562]NKJ22739.1 hypothetical protein [Dyella sp. SG609]